MRLPDTIYGYRVHGPYEPETDCVSNPNKLLLDSAPKSNTANRKWTHPPAIFGYKMETGDDTTFDECQIVRHLSR